MTADMVPMADFKQLARFYLSVMEGDTHLVEEAYSLMRKYDLVDDDGFEVCGDD